MAGARSDRLGLGIVGLGRLWEARHKPSIARLSDRFRVVAVHDQVSWRAAAEAEELGCSHARGLTELVERPDVDALYLLAPQWFGSFVAELAARSGKPVYYGLPVAADAAGLEGIARAARESGSVLVPELARRCYPATTRLKELLASTLGKPRLVRGHVRLFNYDRYAMPGPSTQLAPLPLVVDPGANMLDWCRLIFGSGPVAIAGFGSTVLPSITGAVVEEDHAGFTLEFPDGGLAQISLSRYHRPQWGEAHRHLPYPGFEVFAERGAAWLEMPDHIHWSGPAGTFDERLPLEPSIGEVLNDQFHRLVTGSASAAPTLEDARAACRLVEAYLTSRREGRRVTLGPA